jgi:hypothetical protein
LNSPGPTGPGLGSQAQHNADQSPTDGRSRGLMQQNTGDRQPDDQSDPREQPRQFREELLDLVV